MAAPVMTDGYRATRNEDGTIVVHDVPVFAEAVDARGKKVTIYDRAKLAALLSIAQREAADGYLPPMHFRHHYDPEVRRAGAFSMKRLGRMRLNGADRWVIFADLVVDADAYKEIQAGKWPYRSVELTPKLDRIRGLALLDHEAPFHRFELLRVRETFSDDGSRGYALCFAEEVRAMADDDKKADDKDAPEGGKKDMAEAPAAAPAAAPDLGAVIAQALATALQPIYEKLGIGSSDAPTEEPGAKDEPAEAPAAASDATTREVRELRGKVVAFGDELAREKKARRVDARAAKLLAAGAGETVAKKFRELAEKDETAANAFADASADLIPPAPAPWADFGGPGQRVSDPPEVAAYADRGPEVLEQARKVARLWSDNRKRGVTTHKLADYLRANVDGFAAAVSE